MVPNKIAFVFFFFVFGSVFKVIHGQDAHYWTNQYGTQAQLMGGVVVGSINDLSSTFYNPGAIALPTNSTLMITTDAAELVTINQRDGAGKGIDLKTTRASRSPSIFAVRFNFPGIRESQFAISTLTRYDGNYKISARRIDSAEDAAIAGSSFSGEVSLVQNFVEPWFGFSWADTIIAGIGGGVTQYIAIRSQKIGQQVIGQAIENNTGASSIFFNEYSYYNVRLLWKFGFSFKFNPFTFGFAVTTPSVNLFGSGSVLVNAFVDNVDINNDGNPDSEMASNYQEKLTARYKSPWSISLGASYVLGRTSIYLSGEWFNAIKIYAVMDPQSFRSQSSNMVVEPDVNHSLHSIINFGVGMQYMLNPHLSFYGGFVTDYSALGSQFESDIATATWNIYHISIGAVFTIKTVDLTLGFGNGYGSDKISPVTDLNFPVKQPSQFFESPDLNEITFNRWKIILGFSVNI